MGLDSDEYWKEQRKDLIKEELKEKLEKERNELHGEPFLSPRCKACGKNPGTENLHSCPFNEEINDDPEENCNCCADCEHQCAMDI